MIPTTTRPLAVTLALVVSAFIAAEADVLAAQGAQSTSSTQVAQTSLLRPGVERSALEKFEALQVSDIPGLEDKAAAGDAEARFLLAPHAS